MSSFEGKVVVVTGGTSGIGRAVARTFASNGARVVIGARRSRPEALNEIVSSGGTATYCQLDVCDHDSVDTFFRGILDELGRIDIAFNNAGIAGSQLLRTADQSVAEWDKVMATNVRGVWLCMRSEIEAMLTHGGGVIVNNSSNVGLVGGDWGVAPYVTSKHGIIGLTKAAALEYAKDHIRINAICPGVTYTELTGSSFRSREELDDLVRSRIPMGRSAEASEVADGVIWLCSEGASFVTGTTLVVDGGQIAG